MKTIADVFGVAPPLHEPCHGPTCLAAIAAKLPMTPPAFDLAGGGGTTALRLSARHRQGVNRLLAVVSKLMANHKRVFRNMMRHSQSHGPPTCPQDNSGDALGLAPVAPTSSRSPAGMTTSSASSSLLMLPTD